MGCLVVDGTGLTQAGLDGVTQISTLEVLGISRNDLSEFDLSRLSELPVLSDLGIYETRIGDADLPSLLAIPKLTRVHLGKTRITNAGLTTLAEMTRLESLPLNGNDISDDGIAALHGLTNLDEVFLEDTDVTAEGVQSLHQALPNCHITWDGGTLEPVGENFGLRFDGVDASVEIPKLTYDGSHPITVECTLAPDPLAAGGARWVLKLAGPQVIELALLRADDGATKISFQSNRDGKVTASYAAIPKGGAFHIAGVLDGERLQVYVNGVTGEPSFSFESTPSDVESTTITNGIIDEVRISNIARYMEDFTPERRFEPDEHTLALYHFDEGEGETLVDSSGNGHHGDIRGGTWVRV